MVFKNVFLLVLLFSFTLVSAQYTDEINSNRPGFSQGAFSVGKNVLQIEAGFGLGKEKHDLKNTETNGFAIDYGVRYGFFKEQLEVSLIGTYQSNNITSPTGSYKLSNFKSNTIGAKYLFYDPYYKRELEGPNLYSWHANNSFQWKDLLPALSVYAGVNLDFSDNPFTPPGDSGISPKIALQTQNNFKGGFVFVTNLIADRIGSEMPTYGYIVTLTHTTTAWFSLFVENQGFMSDFYADQLFRAGTAILVNKNFHVDASVLINFKDTPSLFYGRIGVAYRFDMHDKDEYIVDRSKGRQDKKDSKKKKKDWKKKKKKNRKDNFSPEESGDDEGGI